MICNACETVAHCAKHGCIPAAPVKALGQPAPSRTDFSTWERGNLESFARQAADENLVLRQDLKLAMAAWHGAVRASQSATKF